jgi:DNA-binding NtrC family response regulator
MASVWNSLPRLATGRDVDPIAGASSSLGTSQCLVVSGDPARLELLHEAALDGGWSSIACGDLAFALQTWQQSFICLAVLDLQAPPAGAMAPLKSFAEQIAAAGGTLLVTCGNSGDASEELWARQLGTWLYLPGVSMADDLSAVLGEAHQLSNRLRRNVAKPAVRLGRMISGRHN